MRYSSQRYKKIEWHVEATYRNITIKEAEEKIEWYSRYGEEARTKCSRRDWLDDGTYRIDVNASQHGFFKKLYCKEKGKYIIYGWHDLDDNKNTGDIRHEGQLGMQSLAMLFKQLNGGKTMYGAFGHSSGEEIRKCVPGEIYFVNELKKGMNLRNVSKADYSSHYPAGLLGRLPSFRSEDIVRVKGVQEPTDEYPFAFYVESGHLCEKDVFDTRKWGEHPFGKILYMKGEANTHRRIPRYKDIPEHEEKTILCRASECTMDREIQYFYEYRKTNERAKAVMNKGIGFMHPKSDLRSNYRFFHLAAVAIGRRCQKMLEKIDEIGHRNILMVINDSIIYYGDYEFSYEKKLGEMAQEIYMWDFRMRGTNQYVFVDPKTGEIPAIEKPYVAHGGFDVGIEETKKLEDIEKWSAAPKTKKNQDQQENAKVIRELFDGRRA